MSNKENAGMATRRRATHEDTDQQRKRSVLTQMSDSTSNILSTPVKTRKSQVAVILQTPSTDSDPYELHENKIEESFIENPSQTMVSTPKSDPNDYTLHCDEIISELSDKNIAEKSILEKAQTEYTFLNASVPSSSSQNIEITLFNGVSSSAFADKDVSQVSTSKHAIPAYCSASRLMSMLNCDNWSCDENFSTNQFKEFYNWLREQERTYEIPKQYFERHETLQPRMRAILFDWIKEVCEEYALHRETFHLAINFVDRFLLYSPKIIDKNQLQLAGTTAMLLASKLEEIRPPKVCDFAYVTDGACTSREIIETELEMVKALRWNLVPVTANTWTCMFMQFAHLQRAADLSQLSVPNMFSVSAFAKVMQLVDMAVLDDTSITVPSSILSIASLYVTYGGESEDGFVGKQWRNDDFLLSVSGFIKEDFQLFLPWLEHLWMQICLTEPLGRVAISEYTNSKIMECDRHNIQVKSHEVTLLKQYDKPGQQPCTY